MRCIELGVFLHDERLFDLVLKTLLQVQVSLLQKVSYSLHVFAIERLIEIGLVSTRLYLDKLRGIEISRIAMQDYRSEVLELIV